MCCTFVGILAVCIIKKKYTIPMLCLKVKDVSCPVEKKKTNSRNFGINLRHDQENLWCHLVKGSQYSVRNGCLDTIAYHYTGFLLEVSLSARARTKGPLPPCWWQRAGCSRKTWSQFSPACGKQKPCPPIPSSRPTARLAAAGIMFRRDLGPMYMFSLS